MGTSNEWHSPVINLQQLLLSLCTMGLFSCGGGNGDGANPPSIYPAEGTVLSRSCSGTTLTESVADGSGGTTSRITGESTECGYVEPTNPPYGTLLSEGCSEEFTGVKWFQYADGDGGVYVEKDERSVECGYSRTLTLTLDKEYGDRFDPVIVDVEYLDINGDPQPWGMSDSSTTIGYAERVSRDKVFVYGDGRLGDGIFTLGREEIQFRMQEEPVCELFNDNIVGQKVDCMGYSQRTSQEHIYYGEDDATVVTWELGVLIYDRELEGIQIGDKIAFGSDDWQKWEKIVEQYNEVYEKSGVHIRYELKELYYAKWETLGNLKRFRPLVPEENLVGSYAPLETVDIILGRGKTYPDTCGVASVSTYFREFYPPVSMSDCGIYTDLHELGHSVGLAHGPENQSNAALGYIFPEFGHGWNDICGLYDDIMSYGYDGIFHTNETLSCEVVFLNSGLKIEGLAGDRQFTDSAYHLNRVRYLVSLIHDENKYVEGEEEEGTTALDPITVNRDYVEIEVID